MSLRFHPIPFPSPAQEDLETQTITLEKNAITKIIGDWSVPASSCMCDTQWLEAHMRQQTTDFS